MIHMKAKKIVHVKEEGAKVLLVGDMAGYGKISIGAMIPIMSHMALTYIICRLRWFQIRWTTGCLRYWIRRNT